MLLGRLFSEESQPLTTLKHVDNAIEPAILQQTAVVLNINEKAVNTMGPAILQAVVAVYSNREHVEEVLRILRITSKATEHQKTPRGFIGPFGPSGADVSASSTTNLLAGHTNKQAAFRRNISCVNEINSSLNSKQGLASTAKPRGRSGANNAPLPAICWIQIDWCPSTAP